jgi:hypothetical protein
MESNTTSDSFDYLAAARFAGWFHLIVWVLGFRSLRSLHPRPGSPAEHLGWGGSLYAVARSAGSQLFWIAYPGVCSLRSLHPRLYAHARFAGLNAE